MKKKPKGEVVTKDSCQLFVLPHETLLILGDVELFRILEGVFAPGKEPIALVDGSTFLATFDLDRQEITVKITVCKQNTVHLSFADRDDFVHILPSVYERMAQILEEYEETHGGRFSKRPRLREEVRKETLLLGFLLKKAIIADVMERGCLYDLSDRFHNWCAKESRDSLPTGGKS